MKRVFLIFLFLVALIPSLSLAGQNVEFVGEKWNTTAVAADTPWTIVNQKGDSVTTLGLVGRSDKPVKHLFQFSCLGATVPYLNITKNSITIRHNFNSSTNFGVSDGVPRGVTLLPGMTYEILHKGPGSIACAVIIVESFNVDL